MPKLINLPFAPHKYQQTIYNELKRFTVAVCHRRFGKTVLAVNVLVRMAVTCPLEMPRFAYICPTNKQARDVAFEYLKKYTKNIPGRKVNETNGYVQFLNGARITLYGAENADNLRGMYLDGVVLDEVAMMKESVWGSVIRPLLTDRKGWSLFIGTPMGKNMFYKLYQQGLDDDHDDWASFMFKIDETDVLDPAEIDAARKTMSIDEFAQEFMCSFEASIKGSYYANVLSTIEEQGRLGGYPWIPEYPVYTAWDLGYKDDTAIWFYQKPPGGYPRIIDYYESNQKGMLEYANLINSMPYFYGGHYAPHDVKKHELGSGKTIKEIAANYNIRFQDVKRIPIQDGINYVRTFLLQCYFNTDNERVAKAVDHLRAYRRDYDERLSVFRIKPVHDGSSHAADAFRYLSLSYEQEDPSLMGYRSQQRSAVLNYSKSRLQPLAKKKANVDYFPHRNAIKAIR